MRDLGVIPLATLRRRWPFVTVGTLKTLRPDANPDRSVKNGQMAQGDGFVVTVKFVDRSTAVTTHRRITRADDSDHQALIGLFVAFYSNIGRI